MFKSDYNSRKVFLKQFKQFGLQNTNKMVKYINQVKDHNLLSDIYNFVIKQIPYDKKKKMLQSIILNQLENIQTIKIKLQIMKQSTQNKDVEMMLLRYSSLPQNVSKKVVKWISQNV